MSTTAAPTVPEGRTRLPEHNLDVLRAIAVLCVVADHMIETLGYHWGSLVWLGQAGVQAFFVHTSLVLMASLERDGAPNRPGWVRRFYIRRAFRIYPLAWFIIAIIVIFHLPAGTWATWDPVPLPRLLGNLALVQDLARAEPVLPALWTLPIELEMYVVLPLCFLIARRRPLGGMLLLVLAGLVLASIFSLKIGGPNRWEGMGRLQVLQFVPCFVAGVFSYWLLRRRTDRWPTLPSWIWPLVIFGVIWFFYYAWIVAHPRWPVRAMFCAVLGLTLPFIRDAAPSLPIRWANTVAVYSYGIYLVHQLAIRAGFRLLKGYPQPLQFAVSVTVLVAGVWFAYHFIEKPGIALGKRLVDGPGKGPSLEATAPPP